MVELRGIAAVGGGVNFGYFVNAIVPEHIQEYLNI